MPYTSGFTWDRIRAGEYRGSVRRKGGGFDNYRIEKRSKYWEVRWFNNLVGYGETLRDAKWKAKQYHEERGR